MDHKLPSIRLSVFLFEQNRRSHKDFSGELCYRGISNLVATEPMLQQTGLRQSQGNAAGRPDEANWSTLKLTGSFPTRHHAEAGSAAVTGAPW